MAYTKVYPSKELAKIKAWALEQQDSLPADLQLDTAVYLPDLRRTVGHLVEVIDAHGSHPAFYGEIELLFRIREALKSAR